MGEKVSWARRGLLVLLWLPVIALTFAMWLWERRPMMDREPLSPIRFIDVQINRGERDSLTQQIRNFAAQQKFELIVKPSSPDPDDIFYLLWRGNIQLAGTKNVRNNATKLEYSFGFYRQRQMPMPSISEIDPLMASLKAMLADVPGLMITKEKCDAWTFARRHSPR